jgi:hypothetical protein
VDNPGASLGEGHQVCLIFPAGPPRQRPLGWLDGVDDPALSLQLLAIDRLYLLPRP